MFHTFIGPIPNSVCLQTRLNHLFVSIGDAGVTCAPLCLSSIGFAVKSIPVAVCPSNQDYGLCGLVAATNIPTVSGYGLWNCTNLGFAINPCLPVTWPGLNCVGNNVTSFVLNGRAFIGNKTNFG